MEILNGERSLAITDMPDDVLSYLFSHCISPDLEERVACRDVDPLEPPLLLTQISSRLRAVSLSKQSLWADIIYCNGHRFKDRLNLLNLQLQRSGTSPLQVFYSEVPFEGEEIREIHPCLELLMHHSHRWKNVFFNIPSRSLVVLDTIRNRLPSLESLQLQTSDGHEVSDGIAVFTHAPRLRLLEISNHFRKAGIPWSQLTLLRIPGDVPISLKEALDILTHCTHLEECRIKFFDLPHTSTERRSVLIHRHLRVLDVNFGTPSQRILEVLTAPDLVDLRLSTLPVDEWSDAVFEQFIDRSQCHLSSVALRMSISMTPQQLIKHLRLMPSLARLEITHLNPTVSIADALFTALTAHDWEDPLCPSLESIYIDSCPSRINGWGCIVPDLDEDVFLSMATSRSQQNRNSTESNRVSCLNYVQLHYGVRRNPNPPPSVKKVWGGKVENEIGNLRRNGMHVSVALQWENSLQEDCLSWVSSLRSRRYDSSENRSSDDQVPFV